MNKFICTGCKADLTNNEDIDPSRPFGLFICECPICKTTNEIYINDAGEQYFIMQ